MHSFDHDGLGRYGDPLNPTADLQAMQTVQQVLYDGGLLFLTVPIGMAGPGLDMTSLHSARYPSLYHCLTSSLSLQVLTLWSGIFTVAMAT